MLERINSGQLPDEDFSSPRIRIITHFLWYDTRTRFLFQSSALRVVSDTSLQQAWTPPQSPRARFKRSQAQLLLGRVQDLIIISA